MSARSNRERAFDTRGGRDDTRRRPRQHVDEDRYGGPPSRHSQKKRERSRSPNPETKLLEEKRRSRMARLRAENEQEEAQLAKLAEPPKPEPKNVIMEMNPEELEGLDEEEQMQKLLGFSGGFATTKGQEVEDNTKSAARGASGKNKARKYRQYMNRKGGFNRPLDKMD